jgi:hypothetical protein
MIFFINEWRNDYTNLVEAPQGLQCLNKKHSNIFRHMEGQTLEKPSTNVTAWVCVVTTQQYPPSKQFIDTFPNESKITFLEAKRSQTPPQPL